MEEVSEPYLELSSNPIRFEAVGQLTNVFFDDSNRQVFTVRSGGVMGVVVKGPDENSSLNFRMEDHGAVISIKFSLDQKVLAVQRTYTSVEFMNFSGTAIEQEYSQSCKKNSMILGFVWSHHNEVALVTDHGIELYLVIPEKRTLKALKYVSLTVQWFVWCSCNKLALLASGHGSQLQPVQFKPGSASKLPKVETEQGRMMLERDVTLATLYNIPAILILRHQSGPHTAEVIVHTLSGPGQAPVKSHVLRLGLSGRFAINVVDDLILVHHQASKTSMVFDIALPGESDGSVTYHSPVVPARSMRSFNLHLPGLGEPLSHTCELYSPNWVVFQPNIVIDAKLGCLWYIALCLTTLCKQIKDLSTCVQLVLKRTGGKEVLLKLLHNAINRPQPPLASIQESFNHINTVYRQWAEAELQSQTALPAGSHMSHKPVSAPRVLIDQNDIYHQVLQGLSDDANPSCIEWVLLAYIKSLTEHGILAQHHLNEMLITTLVRRGKYTSLHQLLQYGVVTDSKPLACLLLSLGNLHPAASQLALDMLARMHATEEQQEVLLSQGEVLSAIRISSTDISARKFLHAAQNTNDPSLFHSTLFYFKNSPCHSANFVKDERLDGYLQHYRNIFPSENIIK